MNDVFSPDAMLQDQAQHHIDSTILRLRQLTQIDIQSDWWCCFDDVSIATATQFTTWQTWTPVSLNYRQHIAWEKGEQVLWLGQRLIVPSDLQHYPLAGLTLRLSLVWWATAAQVFVNGRLVQEGDIFDCVTRILLSSAVVPGEAIDLAIRLVSPGHDDGALVQSRCSYECPNHALDPCPEPGFVADELAVLQTYLTVFQPDALVTVATACAGIQWDAASNRDEFDRSLVAIRQQLQPLGDWLKQRQIQLVGHAHLDLAWLWEISDTWEAAERTFKSVLQLQTEFSELTFCHSSPALFAWLEEHRPALFAEIQHQVAVGRWEIVAGLWVEPELNTLSGESIARQVLYGQRYVQEKFGKSSDIAWLPDSFGFCWQVPQILQQGGIQYFVTQKLRWNDSNEFPYELFWWRSPDGTQLLSLMSARIGEGIDPVKMADYACTWEAKTGIPVALWLPGVGDHGGGPTRDMLELARRWQRSPFFPTVSFSTTLNYLNHLKQQEPTAHHKTQPISTITSSITAPSFPIWNDELYLEFHRGCYTTHADQKRYNRQCEVQLYQAELFASIATLLAEVAYPSTEIESAWKKVLFNQFHDILPGSAIAEVYTDVNQAWQEAKHTAQVLLEQSLHTIAAQIDLPEPPQADADAIVVFNALNWARSEVVTLAIEASEPTTWQIYDADGEAIVVQQRFTVNAEQGYYLVSFWASEIPPVGYRVFWRCRGRASNQPQQTKPLDQYVLENEWLRVTVNPETGDLASVFDKRQQREILSGAGNELQAFQDAGQYWDAWNIDPKYAEHRLPPAQLKGIYWDAQGALETRIRVIRTIGQSTFEQTYCLQAGSAGLHIHTLANWQEQHVMVKAAFPLNLEADYATYESPYGTIARSTRPKTPEEAAKWEVPALHWADLSTPDYGVSLLNDCKYGYDSQPSQLRLTLLRSPNWPHPDADRGIHEFTYVLYPHAGDWRSAQTVRRGYELNQPLQVVQLPSKLSSASGRLLPPVGQFFNLQAENLVVTAFKRSEDHPNQWILRCYECNGQPATLNWQNELGLAIAHSTNLLEVSTSSEPPNLEGQTVSISPWKIATFTLMQQC